jgi:hypothetical protein
MGAWGSGPFDNDDAADWFGGLFEKTKLAARVEKALNTKDLEDEYGIVRAAAFVVVQLGHNFVWPVDDLDRHLQLAIDKLEEVKGLEEVSEDPEFVAGIEADIATLKARLKKD